jgi:ABC-2 type transport system ATP-binding protein
MITGFLPLTAGKVTLDGLTSRNGPSRPSGTGYLPETLSLYPEMRVIEYVRFRAELCGVARRDMKSRVDEAVQKCFVDDVAMKPIANLSKGYKQRVGLAGALVHRPKVLVLDEPTVGLDPRQIVKIRDLIRELKKDHTILLSTHILPEVELVCDRVVITTRRVSRRAMPDPAHPDVPDPGLLVAVKGDSEADPCSASSRRDARGPHRRAAKPRGAEAERGVDLREAIFREVLTRAGRLESRPASLLEDVFVRLLSHEPDPVTDASWAVEVSRGVVVSLRPFSAIVKREFFAYFTPARVRSSPFLPFNGLTSAASCSSQPA